MTQARQALVIGGGIAGPTVATALRMAGIDASVHEAHPSGADRVGAFLTLASNGVDALDVLGVADAVLAASFPTPSITLRSGTGKRLGVVRTGRRAGPLSVMIRRADLYRALSDAARARGNPLEHGKQLVEAVETADGVRARFDDGSEAVGDVLVGCDGVHSTVRRIVDPASPPARYAGVINTGGCAQGVAVPAAPGGYEMIFGRRAFFGYAVAPGGEVWWYANVPRGEEPARGIAPAADDWRAQLLELFGADAGPAVALIEATAEILPPTPIHTVPRLRRWRAGRLVVAGDAAHAPSPTSGQGASLAIEDALVLARCLRDAPTVATALERFEALRRERVERIVRWAARMNGSKAAGPLGRRVRDAVMPAVLRLSAGSGVVDEIYDHHVDWGAPAAATA